MKKRIIIILIVLSTPFAFSAGEISKQKKQQIADILYEIELSGGDHMGYSAEILRHLEKSSGIRPAKYKSNPFDDVDRLNTRGRDIDIYSLLSGGLAIRESLQLESIRPGDESMRDMDISQLPGIKIESHPFEKMLKNRNYKLYEPDKLIPEDFYYIHFNSAENAFSFFNYINDMGKALHNRFSPAPVDFMVRNKLLKQLALRDYPDYPSFYSKYISEIIITGSDPFVVEGSDVTLLIKPVTGTSFHSAIHEIRNYFKNRFSAEQKEITILDKKGSHLFTKDRTVWSFFFTLPDGTVIISTSVRGAEAVINTSAGKRRSLYEAADYRYLRSIYPADKNLEDGFIYFSDKFIRHLVSPELRIKEARRMYEAMKISVLEKYVIFHYQCTGKFPSTLNEVLDSAGGASVIESRKKEIESVKRSSFYSRAVRLEQKDLADWDSFKKALSPAEKKTKSRSKKRNRKSSGPDDYIYSLKLLYKNLTGKQAYAPAEVFAIIEAVNKPGGIEDRRFSGLSIIPGTFTVKSDTWGRINHMTPLIEMETGNISKREADEYKRFVSSYSSFWKDYFDPVGIRLKTGKVMSVETCILPLVNNSVYSLLRIIAGGTPVELHPDSRLKGDTLSMALKVNPGVINQYMSLAGFTDGSSSFKDDIFTGEIQFHIADALPLADFNSMVFSEFFTGNVIRSSEVLMGFLAWSLFHPMRIAVPVKRPGSGMQLANSVISRLMHGGSSDSYVQYESYLSGYGRYEIRVVKLTFFNSLITRLYICEKDGILHITSTEKYMKDVLDARTLGGYTSVKGNAVIVYRPSEMVMEKDIYRSGFIEKGLHTSLENFGTIRLLGMLFPDTRSSDLPELAYRYFGFKPLCPLGGEYYYDRRSDEVRNSIYGSKYSPALKIDDRNGGIVPVFLKNFFNTAEIRIELEFTPEGIKTKILSR
jgi:hypothetical protein